MKQKLSSVEWLIDKRENPSQFWVESWKQIKEQAKDMYNKEMIDFANWCRIHDSAHPNEVWMIDQLWDKYNKEYNNEKFKKIKLIKLSEEHYIVVDNSDIEENDFLYRDTGIICQMTNGLLDQHASVKTASVGTEYKITHSTQPLEEWKSVNYGGVGTGSIKIYNKIKELSLLEAKSLVGELAAEKRADDYGFQVPYDGSNNFYNKEKINHYIAGYKQALEDNKERKYTEDDVRKAIDKARDYYDGWTHDIDEIIQSIQPPKEWDVEFVDGRLKLK